MQKKLGFWILAVLLAMPLGLSITPPQATAEELESIAPHLRGNIGAQRVARFLLGYAQRNFDMVVQATWTYAYERQKLMQSLPTAAAEKRYSEMLGQQRREFLAGTGPFPVYEGMVGLSPSEPLQAHLTRGVRIQVADVKPADRSAIAVRTDSDYFVKLFWPDRESAPRLRYERKLLKTTYLVVPVRQDMVAVGQGFLGFGVAGSLQRMTDLDEYWEITSQSPQQTVAAVSQRPTVTIGPQPPPPPRQREFLLRIVNWRRTPIYLWEDIDGREVFTGEIPGDRVWRQETTASQNWVVKDYQGAVVMHITNPQPGPDGILVVDIR